MMSCQEGKKHRIKCVSVVSSNAHTALDNERNEEKIRDSDEGEEWIHFSRSFNKVLGGRVENIACTAGIIRSR